jgi:hypothetical protein
MVQALLLIPAVDALLRLGGPRISRLSQVAAAVGIVALSMVALMRLLLLVNPAVSDILFMGPMGFVGGWLVVVNRLLAHQLSKSSRVLGTIAGVGLVIVGASFFFLGGLVVLTDGPFAYANDVDFHAGIALGGLPGFTLFPIWAILVGRELLAERAPNGVASPSTDIARVILPFRSNVQVHGVWVDDADWHSAEAG